MKKFFLENNLKLNDIEKINDSTKISPINISDCLMILRIQRFMNHFFRHDAGASAYSLSSWDKLNLDNNMKIFFRIEKRILS